MTNITVPLLGLVDTAIVGHMGDATYIGAICGLSLNFKTQRQFQDIIDQIEDLTAEQ